MAIKQLTVGQELVRIDFSKNDEVFTIKKMYADLIDTLTRKVFTIQDQMNETPAVIATDTISNHMEVIKKGEETIRCFAEATKVLEISCMFAVKGLTS